MNHEIVEKILSITQCCEKPLCGLDGGFLRYRNDLNEIINNQDDLIQVLCNVENSFLDTVIRNNRMSFDCLLLYGLEETQLNQYLRFIVDNFKFAFRTSLKLLLESNVFFKTLDRDNQQIYLKHLTPKLLKDEALLQKFHNKFQLELTEIDVPEELNRAFSRISYAS